MSNGNRWDYSLCLVFVNSLRESDTALDINPTNKGINK